MIAVESTTQGLMRSVLLVSLVGLAACAAQPETTSPAQQEAEEGVCAMTVADHIGAPVEAVTASWEHATPDGGAVVAVQSADNLHTCEIGADLTVRRLVHPRTPAA